MSALTAVPGWLQVTGAVVMVLGVIMAIMPKERKVSIWLALGLRKLKIGVKVRGHQGTKERGFSRIIIVLDLESQDPGVPVYIETSEPSKRWCLIFNKQCLKRISWNGVSGSSNDKDNPRVNLHQLKDLRDEVPVFDVFFYPPITGYEGPPEFLSYKIICGGITVKRGDLAIV